MDKKIIFFDVDGTIYSFAKGMPKDTIEAIKQLKKNGHIPVICTGRTRVMVYDEFIDAGFEHIVAGAGTYVECNGKEIYYNEMDEVEVKRLADGFERHGFYPIAEGRYALYMGKDDSDLVPHARTFVDIYRKVLKDKCRSLSETGIRASKVSSGFTNSSDVQGMTDEFGDKYTVINHNDTLLELIPKGISKADGIEVLINKLGIPRENTYAFGDSFNDLEMLRYVEYGVAMGNSDPAIFDKVKYRTGDFDKGGIAEGLRMFGLI